MPVLDWRAWGAQNGGVMPNPAWTVGSAPWGEPWQANTPFPGVLPITDKILGANSYPVYADTPVTVNAIDPFYVSATGVAGFPNGAGWVAPMERPGWPAGAAPIGRPPANSTVPAGPIMRPVVAGLSS